MTTIRKPDETETTSLHVKVNVILDYLFKEDSEENNLHNKNIRKTIEEPIHTNEDAYFTQKGIRNPIESFNHKKAPVMNMIKSGIYQRTFHMFPIIIIITIYNQCFKRGCFPKRWKIAKVIPVTKHAKENSWYPSKYRPVSLLNVGGNILEKLLINGINHHLYKDKLLTDRQFGFPPQRNTIEATINRS
jgi:hypothetical protein